MSSFWAISKIFRFLVWAVAPAENDQIRDFAIFDVFFGVKPSLNDKEKHPFFDKFSKSFNLQSMARAWYDSKKSKIAKNVENNHKTIIVYDIGSFRPLLRLLGSIY